MGKRSYKWLSRCPIAELANVTDNLRIMTNSSTNDSQHEHDAQDNRAHGEASAHGHTGEGAASAFAHMVTQDQNRRRQNREPEEPSSRNA
jgi:hypothetical protein